MANTSKYVRIIGFVDAESGSGKIDFVLPLSGLVPTKPLTESPVHIRFANEKNETLAVTPIPLQRLAYGPGAGGESHPLPLQINVVLNLPPNASRMEVLFQGQVVDTYPQTKKVLDSNALSRKPERVLNWSTRGGMSWKDTPIEQTYILEAKTDSDSIWQTISIGKTPPDLEIEPHLFMGAKHVQLRLLAIKGFQIEVVEEKELTLT